MKFLNSLRVSWRFSFFVTFDLNGHFQSNKVGASSRWSFGPNWTIIVSTIIMKTHFALTCHRNLPDGSYISFEQDNWSLEFCSLSGPIFSFSQSFCCRIICILAHAFKIQIFLVNNIFKLCHCSVLIVHMNFSLLELLISNTDSIFDSETLFLTIYNISETVSSRTFWLSIILSENKIIFQIYLMVSHIMM